MTKKQYEEQAQGGTGSFSTQKSHWIVLASFCKSSSDQWLDDFIQNDNLNFTKILPPRQERNWHLGRRKITPTIAWITHFWHSRTAINARPDGIITCFPQLAMTVAVWKYFSRTPVQLIAYNFNLGALRSGLPRRLARVFAAQINHFVVHSPEEVHRYADYLGLSPDRFSFVPLQRGSIPIARNEDIATPFIVAMGSAHRDYTTLIKAVDRLGLRTIIVTREADIDALPKSPHVSFLSKLSETECLQIMAKSRICVTPIENLSTASGQVTFVNAMKLGVPVIATRCPGTDGYITHAVDGILVNPFDVDDLATAISSIWHDTERRTSLAQNAQRTARICFSDEMAADRLLQIIHRLPTLSP